MRSILVFKGDSTKAQDVLKAVGPDYRVSVISSPKELDEFPGGPDVLLLDLEASERDVTGHLLDHVRKSPFPIILLTAAADGRSIGEAIDRVRSCSYVTTTGDYAPVLQALIRRAIEQATEKRRLHQAILALKQRLDETEKRFAGESEKTAGQDTKGNILEEIIFVFKRGEIELPSHPKMAQRFREMIDRGVGTQEIALLLKRDAAVSSKLISISNSPFYRGRTNNQTLEQALSRLGLDTARKYVEVILHRTLYTTKNKKLVGLVERLWEHSLSCAYASQTIAENLKLALPDDPFTLGLLHDIGKLVLLQTISELQMKNKIGDMIDGAEISATLEAYHGRFGTSLLKLWNYPSGYQQVTSYHDALEKADPITKELLVVHFANLLSKSMGYDMDEKAEIDLESVESYRLLELEAEAVLRVKERVQALMDQSREFFSATARPSHS